MPISFVGSTYEQFPLLMNYIDINFLATHKD